MEWTNENNRSSWARQFTVVQTRQELRKEQKTTTQPVDYKQKQDLGHKTPHRLQSHWALIGETVFHPIVKTISPVTWCKK